MIIIESGTQAASNGRKLHETQAPRQRAFLVGAEAGRQWSDNFRSTAYFDGNATSVSVPVNDPVTRRDLVFRQSASDADNDTRVTTASLYAQDQLSLSRHVKLVAGARYERFALRYKDNRADAVRKRTDNMISPRAGVILKPADPVSIYGSYSVSFLPGSGDQFASLTEVTSALEPERFTNYEAGLKWDVLDRLALDRDHMAFAQAGQESAVDAQRFAGEIAEDLGAAKNLAACIWKHFAFLGSEDQRGALLGGNEIHL